MRRHPRHPELVDPDPDQIDTIISSNVALASRLDPETRVRLRELSVTLIGAKRWEPIRPLELTTDVMVTVAANAVIPVLGLDLSLYRNVRSIIVRPSAVTSTTSRRGPVSGVVSHGARSTIGETAPHSGPLSISWAAAQADSRRPESGRNVVIHEFAHKIDMSDGYTDGTPPLRGAALLRWTEILADEYERPEVRPSDDALRAYAWTSTAEFFAVATEAFFCTPAALAGAKPALYSALADYYRQDPTTWEG